MHKQICWIYEDPYTSLIDRLVFILIMFSWCFLYIAFAHATIGNFIGYYNNPIAQVPIYDSIRSDTTSFHFVIFHPPVIPAWKILINKLFWSCVSAPLWEEAAFRWAPLFLLRRLAVSYKFPVLLAVSALFGYMHGDVNNVWFQGVLGLGLGITYIKTGYNYWSSVTLHSMWNLYSIFS